MDARPWQMPKRSVGYQLELADANHGYVFVATGRADHGSASEPPTIQGPMVLGPRFPSIKSEPATAKHKAHSPGRCVHAN
jgi:hypothetical protein